MHVRATDTEKALHDECGKRPPGEVEHQCRKKDDGPKPKADGRMGEEVQNPPPCLISANTQGCPWTT